MSDHRVEVQGPLGRLSQAVHPGVEVVVQNNLIEVKRKGELPTDRSLHGLTRALLANMVTGVTQGFKKELDIQGVGYRAEVKGNVLNLTLGFSHPVMFPIPEGIKIAVDKQIHVSISGADRALVGQVAADIRRLRLPEPYKGKGIRYSDEVIRRKAGKAAATTSGGK